MRFLTIGAVFALLCVLLCLGESLFAQEPGGSPATSPADKPSTTPASSPASAPAGADAMAKCIEAIGKSDNGADAAKAYSRGCGIDRANVLLHDAYMKRMLQLGQPGVALYAAQVLISAAPDNALAGAVVAYSHGKRNAPEKALRALLRTTGTFKDDKPTIASLGQLIAWQEHQPKPLKLSKAEQSAMEKIQKVLAEDEDYRNAYERVAKAYDDYALARKLAQGSVDDAQSDLTAAQKDGQEIEKQYNDAMSLVHDSQHRLADLRSRRNALPVNDPERVRLERWISDEQGVLDGLRRQTAPIKKQLDAAKADFDKKRVVLNKANKELSAIAPVANNKVMEWSPPAVDGVAVPEAPAGSGAVVSSPASQDDDEAIAGRQLNLAKAYLDSGMKAKALPMLKNIVDLYGKTQAAKQAKTLLKDKK